jgi:hypothetical protein
MFRPLAFLLGLAVLAASLTAQAASPRPGPARSAKMLPLMRYLGGPQPDPPAKALRRPIRHVSPRGVAPPAAP